MKDLLHHPKNTTSVDCPKPDDGTVRIAMASLTRCRRSVCSLPLLAPSEPLHRRLAGLVAWYQRVCEDDRYTNDAPKEGLRALSRMAMLPKTSDMPSVIVSAKAALVAEELVLYRRAVDLGGEADPTLMHATMSDLMVAMRRTEQ